MSVIVHATNSLRGEKWKDEREREMMLIMMTTMMMRMMMMIKRQHTPWCLPVVPTQIYKCFIHSRRVTDVVTHVKIITIYE